MRARAVEVELRGILVPICGREDLIAMKLAAGRRVDHGAIAVLTHPAQRAAEATNIHVERPAEWEQLLGARPTQGRRQQRLWDRAAQGIYLLHTEFGAPSRNTGPLEVAPTDAHERRVWRRAVERVAEARTSSHQPDSRRWAGIWPTGSTSSPTAAATEIRHTTRDARHLRPTTPHPRPLPTPPPGRSPLVTVASHTSCRRPFRMALTTSAAKQLLRILPNRLDALCDCHSWCDTSVGTHDGRSSRRKHRFGRGELLTEEGDRTGAAGPLENFLGGSGPSRSVGLMAQTTRPRRRAQNEIGADTALRGPMMAHGESPGGTRRVLLDRPLLTADQAGALLGGIPRFTVLQMARDGRLPCLRIGRHVRFCPAELEECLSRRRRL